VLGDHSSETWVAAEELIKLKNRKINVNKIYQKIEEKKKGCLLIFLAIIGALSFYWMTF
jgi:hypothetical protein